MEMIRQKNQRIQILRAIAIFAVVLIHTAPPPRILQVFVRPFLNFAVAAFIFLSGYLTKLKIDNLALFYRKRILRVLIPYLIWSLLYSVPLMDPHRIIINLLTGKANGTLYYIFVYIQFVLLTPLLSKLIVSKFKWIGWMISPLSCIFFQSLRCYCNFELSPAWELINYLSCTSWFIFYYLGMYLGNNPLKKFDNVKLYSGYIFSVLLQFAEGYFLYLQGDPNCGTQNKLSVLLTNVFFLLIVYRFIQKENSKNLKLLVAIGDCSFGIYLSHIAVIWVLGKIPYYRYIPYVINSVMVLGISFVCVLLGRKIVGERISKYLGLK